MLPRAFLFLAYPTQHNPFLPQRLDSLLARRLMVDVEKRPDCLIGGKFFCPFGGRKGHPPRAEG